MNLALLVTPANLKEIEEFVKAAAESQEAKCNGAICVAYQKRLGSELIEKMTEPLQAKFSAAVSLPVMVSQALSNDGQIGTTFASFLSSAYAMFPGPWLIVDGQATPNCKDFMQRVAEQHKLLGGKCSGRYSLDGGGITPVGPTVVGLPIKSLKWFRSSLNESWRARARFLFGRCSFSKVPIKDYLFSVKGMANREDAPPLAPVQEVKEEAKEEVGEEAKEDGGMEEGVTEDASPEQNAGPVRITPYDNLSDEDLRTQIDILDLPKPHHKAGRAKLLSILIEAEDARKSAQ